MMLETIHPCMFLTILFFHRKNYLRNGKNYSTPMRVASEMEIGGGNNWRIYEYICRHFLASFAPNCKYKKTKIKFSVGEEEFSCSGSEIIEEGFVTIMPWCKVSDIILPDLSVTPLKTQFPITHLPLISGVTAPPGYLSESELISQVAISLFFFFLFCK